MPGAAGLSPQEKKGLIGHVIFFTCGKARRGTRGAGGGMATGNERSRVLEAFRAVGVVALPLKCPVLRRGADNFVTTSVKNGFQVFDCKSLRLLFVSSPATQRGIKALEVHGDFTFAASGAVVHKFKRGKEVGQLGPLGGNVTRLLVVGDNLFVHSSDGELVGYDAKTSDEIMRMDLVTCGVTAKASRAAAKITAWVHPLSYLNKLLLGDEEGSLFVVNVRSCKCVHRFAPLGSGVTAIAQSPAIDVVSVGLADGRIVVRNIKFDETLFEFTQTDGAVTDLSFRTDNTSFLASSSSNGGVYIWDLEEQRLISSMPRAHDSQVCTCTFLQGEPILLTSGGDNALKMWIFDQDDGSARLLRSRNGHSAPPTRVRYYSQHTLLSGMPREPYITHKRALYCPSKRPTNKFAALSGARPLLPDIFDHPRPAEPRDVAGAR